MASFLLLQTGDHLLLQTGDRLLLESSADTGAGSNGARLKRKHERHDQVFLSILPALLAILDEDRPD